MANIAAVSYTLENIFVSFSAFRKYHLYSLVQYLIINLHLILRTTPYRAFMNGTHNKLTVWKT